MPLKLFKKELKPFTLILIGVFFFGSAMLFKGCPKDPEIKYVEVLKIDEAVVKKLQAEVDSISAANVILEERAIVAERNVDIIARQTEKTIAKYRAHREDKDTAKALASCDTLAEQNETLIREIDSSRYNNKLLLAGKTREINTQKVLIDTLTNQNKQLTLENTRLVKISNENAAAAKKAQRKNKLNSFLTRVEGGVILVLVGILAIKN